MWHWVTSIELFTIGLCSGLLWWWPLLSIWIQMSFVFLCFSFYCDLFNMRFFFFWNFESNFWYFLSIANESDTIEPGNLAKSEHTCKYGNSTLNVGDKIKTTDPCLECSCETPPFAQCTRIITTESCHPSI